MTTPRIKPTPKNPDALAEKLLYTKAVPDAKDKNRGQGDRRLHLPRKILGQLNSSNRVEIHLDKNDSAWDPVTGRVSISGPARLTYTKTKDGVRCKIDRSVSK